VRDTGFVRDDGRDPYGSYTPPGGYYANGRTLFAPLVGDDRLAPKAVVVGVRTTDGVAAVPKTDVVDAGLVAFDVGGVPHLSAFDPRVGAVRTYRTPEAVVFDLDPAASSRSTPVVGPDGRYAPDRLSVRVRDARAVLVVAGTAYLLAYLAAIGHLRPGPGAVVVVVADPVARALEPVGFLAFEPVALVDLAVVRLLVAPVNVAPGVALGALVGVNLAVSYLVWRHPAACGIDAGRGGRAGAGSGTGLLAGLPALLSGADLLWASGPPGRRRAGDGPPAVGVHAPRAGGGRPPPRQPAVRRAIGGSDPRRLNSPPNVIRSSS
jgi:hypothetical protein